MLMLMLMGLHPAAFAQTADGPVATPAPSESRPQSSLLWSISPNPTPLLATPAPAPAGPFAVRLAVDLPIVAVASALALGTELAKGELPGPSCGLTCDPQGINALDRTVPGNRSAAANLASHVFVGAAIGLPFALDLIDVLANRQPGGMRGYGEDFLVLAEVLTINFALNNVIKFAVRRPRPLAYDPNFDIADRTEPEAALSFYSGHSATAFAMATSYSYLFMRRHPGSKLIVPVWLISEAMAVTTAYLRVHAGKHFYTDVIMGAVVGSAIGLLIPFLHRRVVPESVASRLAGLHLSVVPMISTDGGGLLVSAY